MDMSEFNERKKLIERELNAAALIGTDENIGNLIIVASLNGLVLMDCDKNDGWVPTPICSFFTYWCVEESAPKAMYLFPADQAIPE